MDNASYGIISGSTCLSWVLRRLLSSPRSCLVVTLVLLVVSSQMTTAFKHHPHPASFARRFRSYDSEDQPAGTTDQREKKTLYNYIFEKKCKYQADLCNPYMHECCPGMECLNLLRGYCRYGMETCICYPGTMSDHY